MQAVPNPMMETMMMMIKMPTPTMTRRIMIEGSQNQTIVQEMIGVVIGRIHPWVLEVYIAPMS